MGPLSKIVDSLNPLGNSMKPVKFGPSYNLQPFNQTVLLMLAVSDSVVYKLNLPALKVPN